MTLHYRPRVHSGAVLLFKICLMNKFSIRPYGVAEFASLYFPHIQQQSAVSQLRRWIVESPELLHDLEVAGWRRYRKILTPRQVHILLDHLGEP